MSKIAEIAARYNIPDWLAQRDFRRLEEALSCYEIIFEGHPPTFATRQRLEGLRQLIDAKKGAYD